MVVSIQKAPGATTLTLTDDIDAALAQGRLRFGPAVKHDVAVIEAQPFGQNVETIDGKAGRCAVEWVDFVVRWEVAYRSHPQGFCRECGLSLA